MFADLKTNSTLGAVRYTSLGVSTVPTAKVTMSQRDQHPADVFWVDDTGASKSMTADATGLRDYERAAPGDRVESTDGKNLPVANYRRLPLLVNQEDDTFLGKTQQLMLECVIYVPDLGHQNLMMAKALARTLDAPIIIYSKAFRLVEG